MPAGTDPWATAPLRGGQDAHLRWIAWKPPGREEQGKRRPRVQGEHPHKAGSGRLVARIAGVGALVVAVVLVALLLVGGDDGHEYNLLFETGGQLVPDNQVLVGGQPVGTIDEISLTEDAQAEVKITTDEPLHEGTTAVIRSTSLSGIANRYISLSPGPDNAEEIPDGGTITSARDDLAGRPRPALQHPRRPHPCSAAEGDPGPGDALHRQLRGGARDLQVLRARAAGHRAPAGRAQPRPVLAEPLLGRGLGGARARSPSAATTSRR